MSRKDEYPSYATYQSLRKRPSVLSQEFPRPELSEHESYYPVNSVLARYFSSVKEFHRFGAESFCEFLADTIEVELSVVIPAVASLRRIPFDIPSEPRQDLFKTATDEGYHAEQSLQYLTDLRSRFHLPNTDPCQGPLFLRRLEQERAIESDPMFRHLITVVNGIVTETRISVELSKFARDETLAETVREICHSHAEDEAVHSSQFRALGRWLWEEFNEDVKAKVARILTASTIARSMPDVDRFVDMFQRATGRPRVECQRIVFSAYNEDLLIEQMMTDAKPTVSFMRQLGTEEYLSFDHALEEERSRLAFELRRLRKRLGR
ncbi:MAG TPA: diiron oxygenase [Longimicrobium sp.]|nr:diiron oxygenase [Longimicrobium sp.]